AKRRHSKSIQRLLRLSGPTRRHSIRTVSTPSFRRSASKSGANTSPVLPEATYGSGLPTCPTRPETPCGESTSHAWHFLWDFRLKPSKQDRTNTAALQAAGGGAAGIRPAAGRRG